MKYNISEIMGTIRDRRTVKPENFSNRKVPKELIEKMLDAARWAPTHGLTQPWVFHVFLDQSIDYLAELQASIYQKITPPETFKTSVFENLRNRPKMATAIIAVGMKRQESEKIPAWEEIASVSCAVQNICLVATSYGIGTYWNTGGISNSQEIKDFLGLMEQDKFMGFLYLGYPSIPWPDGQRRPLEYFTKWHLS